MRRLMKELMKELFSKNILKGTMVAFIVLLSFILFPVNVSANRHNILPQLPDFWEDLGDFDAPPPGNAVFDDAPVSDPIAPARPWVDLHNARAWRGDMLLERSLTLRQEGLNLTGIVPLIHEDFLAADALNTHIDDIIASLIAEARRLRARTITFRFDYHHAQDIFSITIYADIATTMPHTLVRSVNFNIHDGASVTINDAAGINLTFLAERILSEKIRQNPERYYAALSATIEGQAFYITEEDVVILFDGFRLSTRVGDVSAIVMEIPNIRRAVLASYEYRADGPYGLKMIPLRFMVQGQLGFDIYWSSETRFTTISLNGVDLIELRPGDNEYVILGTQRRSLEAPPMLFYDEETGYSSTYVPITFFDQILPLTTYTIDPDGTITFLTYLSN